MDNLWITLALPVDNLWITCEYPVDNLCITGFLWITFVSKGRGEDMSSGILEAGPQIYERKRTKTKEIALKFNSRFPLRIKRLYLCPFRIKKVDFCRQMF